MEEVAAVLDFLYQGEASVAQGDLDSFLHLAGDLQIRGLMGDNGEKTEQTEEHVARPKKETNKKRQSFKANTPKQSVETLKYENYDHTNTNSIVPVEEVNTYETVATEETENQISSMMEVANDGVNKWRCIVCGKASKLKGDIRRHVETHIESDGHPCDLCGKVSRSVFALHRHMRAQHK